MSREVTPILTAQDCIVAMMMAIAISDSNIRTAELVKIQSAVNNLPIFRRVRYRSIKYNFTNRF